MRASDRGHPYKELAVYPGMRPNDVAIWDTFVPNHPGIFDWVWYNVPLGDPVLPGQEREEYAQNGMDGVSYWRVDVVAYKDGTYYAIEIKPNAGAGALGQALCYAKFLEQGALAGKKVVPVVLTDDIAPITLQAANLVGVTLLSA